MREWYFTRHGARQDKADPSWKGFHAARDYDPPLSIVGIRQALAMGDFLKGKIDCIVTSIFLRSIQTAHYVSMVTSAKFIVCDGIVENLRGNWFPKGKPEYLGIDEIGRHYPHEHGCYLNVNVNYPESRSQLKDRCKYMRGIFEGQYKSSNVLFVSHGGTNKWLVRAFTGGGHVTRSCASLTKLNETESGWKMEYTDKDF